MIGGCLGRLLRRWRIRQSSPETDQLRRVAREHEISAIQAQRAAKTAVRRAGHLRVVADAAEHRSRVRAKEQSGVWELVDEALRSMEPQRRDERDRGPC